MAAVPALNISPPTDRRAELKALIKAKQAEQSELQRGILEEIAHLSEEEADRRRAMSAYMDEEMDFLVEEYRAVSAAQGIEPTPRGPAPTPRRQKITPRKAITRPPSTVIKRPPTTTIKRPPGAADKEAQVNKTDQDSPSFVPVPAAAKQVAPPGKQVVDLPTMQVVVEAEKTAVHINPLANFSIVVNV